MAAESAGNLSISFEHLYYKSIVVAQENVWSFSVKRTADIPLLFLRIMILLFYMCYGESSVEAHLLRLMLSSHYNSSHL